MVESDKPLIIGEWFLHKKMDIRAWRSLEGKALEKAYCSIEHIHNNEGTGYGRRERHYVGWDPFSHGKSELIGRCVVCEKQVPEGILGLALVRNADL